MIEELLSDVLRQALKSATPKARTAYSNKAGAQARIGKARHVVHRSMPEQAPDSAFEPEKILTLLKNLLQIEVVQSYTLPTCSSLSMSSRTMTAPSSIT